MGVQLGDAVLMRGGRLPGAVTMRRALSGRLRLVVRLLVFLGLTAGTVWLLINPQRSNIATVLGLLATVLSLLVEVHRARREMSSTSPVPETVTAPGPPSRVTVDWTSGFAIALVAVCVVLLTVLTWRSGMFNTPGAIPAPTTAPAIPPATSAVPQTPQASTLVLPAPIGSQSIPSRGDPRPPGIYPPPDHRFGSPGPMPPPQRPSPSAQTDFGPAGAGISCSPITDPAVVIRAIVATDGSPGIATHNFIDLDVVQANRRGYTYWIIVHLIGTNGNAGPYIAKQQVRSSVGLENDALQLDTDINSVQDIYIVEADPDGTEKLRQNNQLPMDGSQDNQPVRVNPPSGQTVSVTCRVAKTRD